MSNRIIKIKETDNYRVVVISDAHAHLTALKTVIERVNLQPEDYLVILGDFINRGYDSIGTFNYVREIAKRDRTFVLKGNHESFMQRPFDDNDHMAEILAYFKKDPYETFLHKLALKTNFNLYECTDAQTFRQHILTNFDEELDYLRNLPILLYFDDMLFVHGGFEPEFDIETEETKFLKYDFFNRKGSVQECMTIVGHFPTCILRSDHLSNQPYFNFEKNIISIDGGCGVKITGELNAFIIEKMDGLKRYDCIQYNNFPKAFIKSTYDFPAEMTTHVHWPHRNFDLIEKGEAMSRCFHRETGRYFSVFNSLLMEDEMGIKLKTDFANTFFNVPIGTEVSVCKVYDDCALVKYNELFGWVWANQLSAIL
ncbi:MAG: metallophosphoesterase [Clostridia bacterium]|nr:metallophosphoesterase [Clostridia bacterium]